MAERRGAAIALAALGLAAMAFDAAGWKTGKAVASATLLSPAPKVFSAVSGFETYSARFLVRWTDHDGEVHEVALDRARYEGLRGPYNRRNVYGAAIAYGPVLVNDEIGRGLLEAVGDYAFLGDAPLLAELGIPPERVARISVVCTESVGEAGVSRLTFLERER